MVPESVYSSSAPTLTPRAMRETRTPSGLSSRARYMAVVSPSTVGLVARITSSTSIMRSSSSRTRRASGPTPSRGESAPPRMW